MHCVQSLDVVQSCTARLCARIKARPALLTWLIYLCFTYCGSVVGSSIVLFQQIDAGYWFGPILFLFLY